MVQPFTMRSTDGDDGAPLLPPPSRRASMAGGQQSGHLLAPAVTAPRCRPGHLRSAIGTRAEGPAEAASRACIS